MNDDIQYVYEKEQTKPIIKLSEYGEIIRKRTILEIISEFENTVSEDWKSWEVVDFLRDFLKDDNE